MEISWSCALFFLGALLVVDERPFTSAASGHSPVAKCLHAPFPPNGQNRSAQRMSFARISLSKWAKSQRPSQKYHRRLASELIIHTLANSPAERHNKIQQIISICEQLQFNVEPPDGCDERWRSKRVCCAFCGIRTATEWDCLRVLCCRYMQSDICWRFPWDFCTMRSQLHRYNNSNF